MTLNQNIKKRINDVGRVSEAYKLFSTVNHQAKALMKTVVFARGWCHCSFFLRGDLDAHCSYFYGCRFFLTAQIYACCGLLWVIMGRIMGYCG